MNFSRLRVPSLHHTSSNQTTMWRLFRIQGIACSAAMRARLVGTQQQSSAVADDSGAAPSYSTSGLSAAAAIDTSHPDSSLSSAADATTAAQVSSVASTFANLQVSLLALVQEHRRTGSDNLIQLASSQVAEFHSFIPPSIITQHDEPIAAAASVDPKEGAASEAQLTPGIVCALLRSCAYIKIRRASAAMRSSISATTADDGDAKHEKDIESERFSFVISSLVEYVKVHAESFTVSEVSFTLGALEVLQDGGETIFKEAAASMFHSARRFASTFAAADCVHVFTALSKLCPELLQQDEPFLDGLLGRVVSHKREFRLVDLCRLIVLVQMHFPVKLCSCVLQLIDPLADQMRAARVDHIRILLGVLRSCHNEAQNKEPAVVTTTTTTVPNADAAGSSDAVDRSDSTATTAGTDANTTSTAGSDTSASTGAASIPNEAAPHAEESTTPLSAEGVDMDSADGSASLPTKTSIATRPPAAAVGDRPFYIPLGFKRALSSRIAAIDRRKVSTEKKSQSSSDDGRGSRDEWMAVIFSMLPHLIALDIRGAAETLLRRITSYVPSMRKDAWLRCAKFVCDERVNILRSCSDLRLMMNALWVQLQQRIPVFVRELTIDELLHVQSLFVGSPVLASAPVEDYLLELVQNEEKTTAETVLTLTLGHYARGVMSLFFSRRVDGAALRVATAAVERLRPLVGTLPLHQLCRAFCVNALTIEDFCESLAAGLAKCGGDSSWGAVPTGLRSAAFSTGYVMYRQHRLSPLADQICVLLSLIAVVEFTSDEANMDILRSSQGSAGVATTPPAGGGERIQSIHTRYLVAHALTVLLLRAATLEDSSSLDDRLHNIRKLLIDQFHTNVQKLCGGKDDTQKSVRSGAAQLLHLTVESLVVDLPMSSPVLSSHLLTWYSAVASCPSNNSSTSSPPDDTKKTTAIQLSLDTTTKLVLSCTSTPDYRREVFLRCATSLHRLGLLGTFSRELSGMAAKIAGALSTSKDGRFLSSLLAVCCLSDAFRPVISQLAPYAADYRTEYSEQELTTLLIAFASAVANCRTAAVAVAREVVHISRSCSPSLLSHAMLTLLHVDAAQTVTFKQLAAVAISRQKELTVEDVARCLCSLHHSMGLVAEEFRPRVLAYLGDNKSYPTMSKQMQREFLHDVLVLLPALSAAYLGDVSIWDRVSDLVSDALKVAESEDDLATICTLKAVVEPCFLDAGIGDRLPQSLRTPRLSESK